MKSEAIRFACFLPALLALAGCNGGAASASKNCAVPYSDICGTWQAKDSPWRIVIAPDGKLSSALIPMGEVEIKPNLTTRVEMKDGSISTFTAGDCPVEYDPETRELLVTITVKHLQIVYLTNKIEGNSQYFLVGNISGDGQTWPADVIEIFDYGPRFPQDSNDIWPKQIVFEKVSK